jgi:hypothetical protein
MKRRFLTLLIFCCSMSLSAQNSFPGNLGIGIATPTNKLDVFSNNERIAIRNETVALVLGQWDTATNRIESVGRPLYITTYTGPINFGISGSNNLTIANSGNIGIGTTSPAERLSVNGNIRAREVKVENANWPDYVFEKQYKSFPLNHLEKYINKNKHLPGMPTAKEVKENGINLGDMNTKLLQKIEELTLYMIELKKENAAFKAKTLRLNKIQNSRIQKLEHHLLPKNGVL